MENLEKVYFLCVFLVIVCLSTVALNNPHFMGAVTALPACSDKIDNDGDGLIDYPADPGCSSLKDTSELSSLQCHDGKDNDGDGKIDMLDSGCTSLTDNDESNCGDGICEGSETFTNCVADCHHADSCTDSDGGKVATTKGTVTGYLSEKAYTLTDSCATASTVKEYYCENSGSKSSVLPCPAQGYGPNYCSNGSLYADFNSYPCTSGVCKLTRQYYSLIQRCPNSCSNNACNPPPILDKCIDTDGGIQASTFGVVYGMLNSHNYSYSDSCVGSSYVLENYCSGTSRLSQNIFCGNDSYSPAYCLNGSLYMDLTDQACADGRCGSTQSRLMVQSCTYGCINSACKSAPLNTCSDNDGGIALFAKGTTSGYLNNVFYNHSDYCAPGQVVQEFYCQGSSELNSQYGCGINSSINFCVGNSAYQNTTIPYCSNGACKQLHYSTFLQACHNTCQNGICDKPSPVCTDSDGGMLPNIKGNVNTEIGNLTDVCVNGSTVREMYCAEAYVVNTAISMHFLHVDRVDFTNLNVLFNDIRIGRWYTVPIIQSGSQYIGTLYLEDGAIQFSVDPTTYRVAIPGSTIADAYGWQAFACPYGCTDGVCKPQSLNLCNDSDGGLNLQVQGTVRGYTSGYPYTATDYCNSTALLHEFYCSGPTATFTTVNCYRNTTRKCLGGKCV